MKEVILDKFEMETQTWSNEGTRYGCGQSSSPDEYYWLMLNLPIFNFYNWYRKQR